MPSLITRWDRRRGRGVDGAFSKIEKTTATVIHNPTNVYRVYIKVMFGDADFYDTFHLDIPEENEAKLIDFLNFLNLQVATAYPSGRGSDDDYELVVKDWNKWFGWDEKTNTYGVFSDCWPSNYDMGGESTLEKVDVVFFNEQGVSYDVNVE